MLLVLIALRLYEGRRLRAHARWTETAPIVNMQPFPITGAYVPVLPGVHVYVPSNIIVMPLYIRVDNLPGLTLPVSVSAFMLGKLC